MSIANQSATARSDAFDLAATGLEEAASKAAALFVSIYQGLEQRPVAPPKTRAALRATFSGTLVEEGLGLLQALDDFERWVLPGSMGTPHPLYLGLVNSSPLPGAALADLLISSLNNNGGAFHQSPAMTTCEEELVRAFASLFGMPDADGMFLPGRHLRDAPSDRAREGKDDGRSGAIWAAAVYLRGGPLLSRAHGDGRRYGSRRRGLDARIGTRCHGRERARTAHSS